MHLVLIVQILVLLTIANGTPVIARKLLGSALSYPLDGGVAFLDGRPLFGPTKTVRGFLLAVTATIACAALIGLDWKVGAVVGGVAMASDLLSSFIKRRMGLPPSSMALGLDQTPESLFPLLAVSPLLPVTIADIGLAVLLFFAGSLIVSRILFKLNVRERPY